MPKKNIPSYRLHKASGQAVVVLHGKTFYLGQYKSKESRAMYNDIIADYLTNDCRLPPTRCQKEITIEELAVKFLEWAEGYYIDPDGNPTPSFNQCQYALEPFIHHYGRNSVSEFGPLSLMFIRDQWVKRGLARKTINQWCTTIKRAVKWGVAYELVEPEIFQALDAFENLKAGRTKAPEYNPVEPIDDETVDKTLPELPPVIADMVKIQRLAGLRPQDVCNMRACDIDRRGDPWIYRPFKHKTQYRGKVRILAIGPRAQAILLPYLERKADSPEFFLFSPKDSVQIINQEKRVRRKTKVQPSQRNRRKAKPKRTPHEQYTKDSYNRAIRRACIRLDIDIWSPNQLRHSAGTEIRDKYGLEYAQAVLGHSNAKTTEIYAAVNFEKAARVAREIG